MPVAVTIGGSPMLLVPEFGTPVRVAGNAAVKLNVCASGVGLMLVTVTVSKSPGPVQPEGSVIVTTGVLAGGLTVNVAMLLGLPAVGVCVVVRPEVWLVFVPGVSLVTANVTVQLPLAGMVMPLKLTAVAPALSMPGVVPVQVPPTAPPTAVILVSVSVNEAPVSGMVCVFVSVSVTVELSPLVMLVGLNALLMVGSPVLAAAKMYADPAFVALLLLWSLLMPVESLSSRFAPTTIVLSVSASALPNWSLTPVLEAFR